MKCYACGNGSISSRYCKACKEHSCDVCRPYCTLAHRPFHMKLIQVKAIVRRRTKAASPADCSSDDASSAEEQPEPEIFSENHH